MLFLSSRDQLSNEDRVGPDEFWDLKIRRGMLAEKTQIGLRDIKEAVKDKSVLLLVHGYNNEFEDIIRAYDIIERQTKRLMNGRYDVVMGYTWPGGDSRFEYFSAKTRAGVIAPRFSENLRDLHSAATRPQSLDVMTHSMGARVAFEALKHLTTRNVVRNLIHTAAAVDNESIERRNEYFAANARVRNSFILHSRHDQVLNLAYRLAEFDLALGLHGPEDPGDVMRHSDHTYVVNCKRVIRAHGAYKDEDEIYNYLNDQVDGPSGPQFETL
ncbi:MAG: DUF726 domain-containing protein [Planctomycetota bacterium]